MTELKPTKELLRIYGIQKESGDVCGLMIATQLPMGLALNTLKKLVKILEEGQGLDLNDVPIKDPADIRLYTEK